MGHLQKKQQFIIAALNSKGELQNSVRNAFNKMVEYFEMYDLLESTNHCYIINEIYLNHNNYGQTNTCLALRVNLSESTFMEYKKKYLNCFFLLYEREPYEEVAFSKK